ncbi:MAG: CHAT domain-containing protein [Bacteroidales bacterium]
MLLRKSLILSSLICLCFSVFSQTSPEIVFSEYRTPPSDTTWNAPYEVLRNGNFEKADSLYHEHQEIRLENSDFENYLFVANEYSYWLYMERKRGEAESILSTAIETAKGNIPVGHIEMLISNYNMAILAEDIQQKINWYKKFLGNYSPSKYQRFGFIINRDIGSRYYKIGEYTKAWEHWDACQNEFDVDSTSLSDLYTVIGSEIASHDPEIAIEYLLRAKDIIKGKDKYLSDLIMLHANIGRYYLQNSDYENAFKHSKKSNELLLQNQDLSDFKFLNRHTRYTTIIESLIRLGEYEKASDYLKEMREEIPGFPNPAVSEGLAVYYESMMYRMQENYDEALSHLETFNQMYLDIVGTPLSPYLVNYYLDKADVLAAKGQYNEAISYYEKTLISIAANEYTTIDDDLKLLPPENFQKLYLPYLRDIIIEMLESYRLLAQDSPDDEIAETILQLVNYVNTIIKYHFSGIADERLLMETSKHLKETSYYGLFASYHLSKYNATYIDTAFIYSDSPRTFNLNFQKQIANHYATHENSGILKDISELSVEISNLENETSNAVQNERLFKLKSALYRAKVNLTDDYQSAIEFMDNRGVNEQVKSQIESSDAIIQYFAKGDSIFVICYTKDNSTIRSVSFNDFSQSIRLFTRDIKTGADAKVSQKLFYNKLISPIESQLKGVSDLHILADDKLMEIPFEMFMNKSGELLISNHSISYYYSAKGFEKTPRVMEMNILAMAPEFSSNQPITTALVTQSAIDTLDIFRTTTDRTSMVALPHSVKEVEEIVSLFELNKQGNNKVTGNTATKEYFETNLDKYNILHIATHGISNTTNTSGLVFALPSEAEFDESYLRLPELYKHNVSADLVVLSACKTGTGDVMEGEGIMALPRGFIYSGVPNIIASLWKVHDERTKDLMLAFYRHLLQGKSYAEALRFAKIECIERGFLPLDWAGFVLIKG